MDFIKAEEVLPKPVLYICLLISLSIVYVAGKFIYSIFFDKLRHIPGPRLNAVSMVPYARHLIKGTTVKNTIDLHKQYGDVVRIAPNEVSFISADTAFPDIYGFRTGSMKGHLNMNKDPVWYVMPANGAPSILQANDSDHTRGRRILAHAFSERALAAQEPLIQKYIDQLLSGLEKASTAGDEVIDMVRWYNWTTFDVIADLTFGEPFGCLQDQATHQYVALLFSSLRSLRMIYVLAYFPWLKFLGNLVVDQNLIQKRTDYIRWVSGQVKKRMGRQTDRRDFMSEILENNKSKSQGLSQAEIDANAGLILNAGSETTATLLSGVTYLLLKHPAIMQKLKEEIRGTFENYEDIKLDAVSQLSYLMAVLQEALRFFPPLPVGFVRRTNKGGDHISGHYIPENTVVSVSHYAAYHSERNFRDPDLFVPERWLGDERYAHDKRHAYQPFNFGPRSCLGRNLANAEMRLIVAKILWSFDLELQPQSQNWLENCRVMRLWDKPNLEVKLNKVHRVN